MFRFRRTQKPEELDKKLVFSLTSARVPKFAQLKLLPKILTPKERWILRIAGAILLVGFAGVATPYVAHHVIQVPRRGGVYREGLVGTPRLINPLFASSDVDRDLTRLIYSSLLKYNGSGNLVGDIAEDFQIEEGGKRIQFTLRDDVRFHDGHPLQAEDVKFTIDAIKQPVWRSPLWRAFQEISVETPDAYHVVVTAPGVSAAFPHLFTFGILPKHIWEHVDPQGGRLAIWNVKPIGSGPFQFTSLTKTQDGALRAYRLSRFDKYYHNSSYLKEIVVRFFSDFESATAALREHTIDGVSFIPERLRNKSVIPGIRQLHPVFPRFTTLFFQDRRTEVLKERLVRRALAVSLDRNAIVSVVPDATSTGTPFLQDQIGFAKTLPTPKGDLSLAQKFLEGGGWRKDEKGWVKQGKHLTVTLTTLDEPTYLLVADTIKKRWNELGVEVTLEAASRVSFETDVLRPRAYEILLFSVVTGHDPDPYPFWHSTQIDDPGLALTSVRLRGIDVALERGRSILEVPPRAAHYLEFQQLLYEEVPGVVLFSSPYVYALSKRVRGMDLTRIAVPADRFNDVNKWFMRSRLGWR